MSLPRLAAVIALPLLAVGCGASHRAATSSTTAPATTAPAPAPHRSATTTVTAYFLQDRKVAPVAERVPRTRAVANAALRALLDGPPPGYASELPADAGAVSVAIVGGTATVTVPESLSEPSRPAAAQIVYTLTQFSTVGAVELRLAGGTVVLPRTNRAGFAAETPPILVESPLPGAEATSPLRVSGTASVFEGTVRIELVQTGKQVVAATATAAEGAPGRGAFEAELPFTGMGAATVVVYSPNTGEGPAKLHQVDVPVTLKP